MQRAICRFSRRKLGIWEKYKVKMVGVDIAAIEVTENREAFRLLMGEIGVPMAPQKNGNFFP